LAAPKCKHCLASLPVQPCALTTPRLAPPATTQLNPYGVFVVERPDLRQFLQSVAQFAEIVVYTAGAPLPGSECP